MSVRSRVAFACGVGGLAGATAILAGRTDGTIPILLLLALAPIAGAAAGGGSTLGVDGTASLARQVRSAPALALVAATGAMRAGSPSFADARGANAVAGLALARGPALSVAGAWLALAAGAVALLGVAAKAAPSRPPILRALEAGGVIALGVFLGGLFAGPQVRVFADATWWAGAIAVSALIAWRARSAALPDLWLVALVLAGAGLALTIAGGAP